MTPRAASGASSSGLDSQPCPPPQGILGWSLNFLVPWGSSVKWGQRREQRVLEVLAGERHGHGRASELAPPRSDAGMGWRAGRPYTAMKPDPDGGHREGVRGQSRH